tara:strand:+ start:8088 stop:8459 length:372 start_codon:yes stop_codon:yes gene_type:complete
MDSTNYLLQEGTLIRIKGDLDCDLLTVYKNRSGKFSLIDNRGTDVVGSTSYLKDVLNEPDIFYPNWFQIGDILEGKDGKDYRIEDTHRSVYFMLVSNLTDDEQAKPMSIEMLNSLLVKFKELG